MLREIFFASYEDRNIRIAPNSMPRTSVQELEFEIIVDVLVQWIKHRELRPEWEHLNGDKIISKLKTELRVLSEARFGLCSFCDVVRFITEQSSRAGEPALIINLDEAQNLGCSLQNVSEILVSPIIVDNCRMFITITGLCTAAFRDTIALSNVSLQQIILPLLTEMHMVSILASVLGVEVDKLPPGVVDSVKWLGGVPRLLEYFLRHVAKRARANTVQDMWEWLCDADTNSLTDIIRLAGSLITGHEIGNFGIPDDLLDNIFSIAVAEHPVRLDDCLTKEWTVESAQGRSLFYWKGVPGGYGTVIMPPLLLYQIHLNSSKNAGASIHQLSRTMTVSDNESVAVTSLLHKLKAVSITGCEYVLLFEDLMGGMTIDGREDISVTVPKCFNLEVLRTRIGDGQFEVFKAKVLSDSKEIP